MTVKIILEYFLFVFGFCFAVFALLYTASIIAQKSYKEGYEDGKNSAPNKVDEFHECEGEVK